MSTDSWNGILYVYLGDERSPAAVHNLKDFSRLDAKSLSRAAHDQVIANAEILKKQDAVGIKLGHFLTRSPDGKREFACDVESRSGVYNRISMTFMGLGISDSGEVPKLIVEADCKASMDLDWLETVWVPMTQISKLGGSDQEYNTYDANHVSVQVEHMTADWPENWALTNVRLFHANNPDESMIVDTNKLPFESKQKFTFEWKLQERMPSNSEQVQ